MFHQFPCVNDTCEIQSITITAYLGRHELRTDIVHTPEETRDEHGAPVVVKARSFPARVVCPTRAAELLASEAKRRHPHAVVTVAYA